MNSKGFTLIELLIIIGILALLSIFALLILNPIQFMAQGRDTTRMNDLQTINKAINLSKTTGSLVDNTEAKKVYISLPDTNSNLTDDCKTSGEYPTLPALATGWEYRCAASSSNLKKVDGTGWLPINFSSVQPPLVILPVDPINNPANLNYYAYGYDTNQNAYALASKLDSEKYLIDSAPKDGGNDATAFETRPVAWLTGGGGVTYPVLVKSTVSNWSTSENDTRNLARKSNGELWACYYKWNAAPVYTQIYCSYSSNSGVTWTEEQVSSAPNFQYGSVNVAIDSVDNVHVVWVGPGWGLNPDYQNVEYRKRTSSGWEPVESVTDVAYNQRNPVLAIDSANNVHVVWAGGGFSVTYPTATNVVYREKVGGTWQSPELVSDINNGQNTPAIAIDSSDNIHVVWTGLGWEGSNSTIQYRKKTTGSWQPREQLTAGGNTTHYTPAIAVDSVGNVHVVWQKYYGSDINILYRKRTTSWQATENVTTLGIYQAAPSIAIDSIDNVHVVWVGNGWGSQPSYKNVQYRMRNTSGWGTQIGITDRAYDQEWPSLIWAMHPTIGGHKINRPLSGYAFVFTGKDSSAGYKVEYFQSSDLSWE